MDVGIIYAITAFICMLQNALILNRTVSTDFKETIDQKFCNMLRFFAIFCAVDSLWGFFSSKIVVSSVAFTIIAYGYHSLAALSAFIAFGFIVHYLNPPAGEKRVLDLIRLLLLVFQCGAIASNVWSKEGFYVDAAGNYLMGGLRIYLYLLQYSYYIILLAYLSISYKLFKNVIRKYRTSLFFVIVLLAFGIGQYVFYDVALYSIGFSFAAFVLYTFDVNVQREEFMAAKEDKLKAQASEFNVASRTDAMTGLYNRREYEEDINRIQQEGVPEEFTYFSVDLNGLKVANDNYGHEAGDKLIKGIADCMINCFEQYGKAYRIGGDEFAIILNANDSLLVRLEKNLLTEVINWSEANDMELSIAYGIARQAEGMYATIQDVEQAAEKRMYVNKAKHYADLGIDRKGQQEAYEQICKSYTKILKVNLTTDSFSVIQMDISEKTKEKGYSGKISEWIKDFADSGMVFEEDRDIYLKKTDVEYLKQHFREGNLAATVYYKRKTGDDFKNSMLEIIPAEEYTNDNQVVFLYVKNIEK